jgi:hypothetical protein
MSRRCSAVIRTRDPGSRPAVSSHRPESFIHGKVGGSLHIWNRSRGCETGTLLGGVNSDTHWGYSVRIVGR